MNLLVLLVGVVVGPASGGQALAVANGVGSAYSVTPAFQDASVDQQATQDLSIQLANHTATDQSFKLSVADFGSLNESGGVAFLGSGTGDLGKPYGLTSWLTLDHNVVFVPAGKSVKIIATVQNRESLAPGGHYGAVLATAITDEGAPKAVAPQVGLHAVLSSLILLTKTGGAAPGLKLVSERFSHNPAVLPTEIEQRFQSSGNVHVVPRGIVEIRDPARRLVSRGALNVDSEYILPESFRKIPVTLTPVAGAWLPGRYSIVTTYRYDGRTKTKVFRDSVWYAGTIAVWLAWLVLVGGIIFAGWWLWWRRRK